MRWLLFHGAKVTMWFLLNWRYQKAINLISLIKKACFLGIIILNRICHKWGTLYLLKLRQTPWLFSLILIFSKFYDRIFLKLSEELFRTGVEHKTFSLFSTLCLLNRQPVDWIHSENHAWVNFIDCLMDQVTQSVENWQLKPNFLSFTVGLYPFFTQLETGHIVWNV